MHEQLLTCPGCGFSPLDVTVEDGEMLFFCENCGWQKIDRYYFYITGWYVEIRRALAPIDIMQSLLGGPDVAGILRGRLTGPSHLSSYEEASDGYLFGEVQIARQVYLKQMIVLSITYLEQILQDFFVCQFLAEPRRMNSYLSPEGSGQAKIALNDILDTATKEELLERLANQAARRAVDKKAPDKVVERIIKDYGLQRYLSIVKDLQELVKLRNRIVHEGTSEDVTAHRVYESFELLSHVLFVLGRATTNYKMACWDEFGFLDKLEKQLSESRNQPDGTGKPVM